MLSDRYGRQISYMRISVTPYCNMNCYYCMPKNVCSGKKNESEILKDDEILKLVKAAVCLGIKRIKLTGGEPLLRKGICQLIEGIKKLDDEMMVTITTNGYMLYDMAEELSEAGVDTVNVSLDTVNRERYQAITGVDCLDKVKAGIKKAREKGLRIKLNAVLPEGRESMCHEEIMDKASEIISEDTDVLTEVIEYANSVGADVRFIERMPMNVTGTDNITVGEEAASKTDYIGRLIALYNLKSVEKSSIDNGPAEYYRSDILGVRVGFIGPLSNDFCRECNKVRVTYDGRLKTCLFYEDGVNLRESGFDKDRLTGMISDAVESVKHAGHHFTEEARNKYREEKNIKRDMRPMGCIGG